MSTSTELPPVEAAPAAAAVPVPLETRVAAQDFLIEEAHLLDQRRFPEWYALFTDDVVYVAPVRNTRRVGNSGVVEEIGHFDENKASLGLRVRKLGTDVGWAEDPPSITRRFITNVKVEWGDHPDELRVRSYLLLFRSRGDRGQYDLLSAERNDVLRSDASGFRIARRHVLLDQVSLGTKNLAIFL
ncbi:3-phenylpropionate/cinnamic acid dioxygenase subunit beta [Geodermatophilus sp. DSM 44513]|uniref:aromatic-ring-hydroxylating dioxygenase subunit beta n=1 Tax=Geodermatophilus sp. DSM 44513 TaxID=1528104 RepID=UPI00127E0019|nr:3-phenylpropionate/cinnamic acid dioxygenase subunit beta [Geodermatophilus sp. DSM 44513]WNV77100.1 3-phenylpropionate/cinnamic acid dioxygenase subunit beta [Geodermatophilus sp. DSM 44513]